MKVSYLNFRLAYVGTTKPNMNREEPLLLGYIAFFLRMTVTEKNAIFQRLGPVLDIDGFELVDVEVHLETLRLLVHKPGGLSVSDCQAVNRVVRPILEVHQHLASYAALEVASPGVDRPLRTAADFQRNHGRTVRIEVVLENASEYQVQGAVAEVSDDKVVLAQTDGQVAVINISEIRTAHIHLKW